MHFAAYAYVGESVVDPGNCHRNNVAGSLALLEAMRDAGVNNLVFSSTCATYGMPEQPRIREDHPQRPINPYGASKLNRDPGWRAHYSDLDEIIRTAWRWHERRGR